jgi:rhamnogalacturonyl hydrolase YesR
MEKMKLEVNRQKQTIRALEIITDLREDSFDDYDTLTSIACALVMEAINQDFTKEKYMYAVEQTWDELLENIKQNARDGKPLQ